MYFFGDISFDISEKWHKNILFLIDSSLYNTYKKKFTSINSKEIPVRNKKFRKLSSNVKEHTMSMLKTLRQLFQ